MKLSRSGLAGLRFVLHALDVPVLFLLLVASYEVRFSTGLFSEPPGGAAPSVETYRQTFALLAIGWVAFLWASGFYQRIRFDIPQFFRLSGSTLAAAAFTLSVFFFRRDFSYSRLTIGIAFGMSLLGLALFHALKSWVVRGLLRSGQGRAPALVLGPGALALPCLARLAGEEDLGLDFVGYLGDPPEPGMEPPSTSESGGGMMLPLFYLGRQLPSQGSPGLTTLVGRFPRLGAVEDVGAITAEHRVQEIFVVAALTSGPELLRTLRLAEDTPAAVRLVPDVLGIVAHGVGMRLVSGLPVLDIGRSPLAGLGGALKRSVDVVGAGLGLLVLSPLLALIAWGVRRSSPGPVLYAQERVGMDGHRFSIYKFRSMPLDAEASTGPVWAQKGDPRATPFGRMLRKWSLDELPQLWNVLRGDMSLVGPRPERPFFVDRFRRDVQGYMQRHKVKAGITGWAQINGLRGQAPIEERTRYDIWYIENWSLLLDVEILLRTLWICVVRPEG